MDSKIIDGKKLAQRKENELKKRVAGLKSTPKVVSFLIGDNPASVLYTNMKQQKAKELGIDFEPLKYLENISFNEVKEKLISLNNDPKIIGIMLQLPLPKEFLGDHKIEELLELIDPNKDIDGLNSKHSNFMPATVRGVLSIIDNLEIGYKDIIYAVVGSEGEVGQSLVYELTEREAVVIKVDKKLPDTKLEDIKNAGVVISATGVKDLIKPDHLKDNAVLIDVGLGDFDENCYSVASFYTPKVGGTGPMTVISLMENIIEAAKPLRHSGK